MNKYMKSLGLYAVLFIAVLSILAVVNSNYTEPEEVSYTYTDLLKDIEEGEVESVQIQTSSEVIDYGSVTATFADGKTASTEVPSLQVFIEYTNDKVLNDD